MSQITSHRQPDFFILGAMKCGTTSLFNYLVQHQRILSPEEKELHFYDIHRYQGRTFEQYLEQFPGREETQISGEATPFYFTHPHCPAWLEHDFPEAKFIILLRNPVDRFWSQFKQMQREGLIEESVEQAIDYELENGAAIWQYVISNQDDPVDELKRWSLLRRGRYAEQLVRWFDHFDRNRFLILRTEEMLEDTSGVVNKTLAFLGLDPDQNMKLNEKHHTQNYSPMDQSLRKRLEEYYAPHNKELADLLGTDLLWVD